MLFVGEATSIPQIDNLLVFNLTSAHEGFVRLNILPPFSANYGDEREFDINFANYIFNTDHIFYQFMFPIMALYEGRDVFIAVTFSNGDPSFRYFDMVTESLMKLIQTRYGYNYYLLNSLNDFNDINIYNQPTFSLQGVYNLDIDKQRFIALNVKLNVVTNHDGQLFIPEGTLYFPNL